MNDVLIKYDELQTLMFNLDSIIKELEGARDRRWELNGALANPFYRSELREVAEESESRWSRHRTELSRALTTFKQRAEEVIAGFQQFDQAVGTEFEKAQTDKKHPANHPK